jgi:hypothetical protein
MVRSSSHSQGLHPTEVAELAVAILFPLTIGLAAGATSAEQRQWFTKLRKPGWTPPVSCSSLPGSPALVPATPLGVADLRAYAGVGLPVRLERHSFVDGLQVCTVQEANRSMRVCAEPDLNDCHGRHGGIHVQAVPLMYYLLSLIVSEHSFHPYWAPSSDLHKKGASVAHSHLCRSRHQTPRPSALPAPSLPPWVSIGSRSSPSS